MGAVKKLFGGGSSYKAPDPVQVAPTVQAVQTADTSADTENSGTKKKKRQGFASTSVFTALDEANDEKKNTLG